ncbi:MAG: hypothetical protein ABIH18_07665 [Candidatus Omnitrophota bacterium]
MKKKGMILIQVIMIITLMSVFAISIVLYGTQSLMLNISNIDQDKALFMAQAGIMWAIVDYNLDGLWGSARNINVATGLYYHLGTAVNFLWVDTSNSQKSGKTLKRIPIKNIINTTDSITITNMVVEWDFGGNITDVTLAGSSVWSGTAVSPAALDITDTAITAGTTYSANNDQQWTFSNNVPSGTGYIKVKFIFSDGSSFRIYILRNGMTVDTSFSVTSTGEIRNGSTVVARRTLLATYDTGTSNIPSWNEIQSHIIP